LCERCQAAGYTSAATVVHHRDGNQANNAWDNLESLCADCHETHHGRRAERRQHFLEGMT